MARAKSKPIPWSEEAKTAFEALDAEDWLNDPNRTPGLYTAIGGRLVLSADLLPQATRAPATTAGPDGADLFTLREVAERLRMSDRNLRRLIACGRIRAIRARETGSSRVLIERTEVERYLRSLRAD